MQALGTAVLLIAAGIAYFTTRKDEALEASLQRARAVAAEFGTPPLTRVVERREMYVLSSEGDTYLGESRRGGKVVGWGIRQRFAANEATRVDGLVEDLKRAVNQVEALRGVELTTGGSPGSISLGTPINRRVFVRIHVRSSSEIEVLVDIAVKKDDA
jgi:hypothetical protein